MEQEDRAEMSSRGISREEEERIHMRQIKKKKQQLKRQQKLRLLALFFFLCLCGCLLIFLERELARELHGSDSEIQNTHVSGIAVDTRELDRETDARLLSLAQDNPEIAEIYRNKAFYPTEMLKGLSLNPEMLDFVMGWPDSEPIVTGGFTPEETAQEHPLLLQWDSRWGYYPYGGSNMGIAGCGPTCLSMALFALTGDETATPDRLADYSMQNGHYVSGSGTAWTLMTEAPVVYGASAKELGLDENVMKRCLDGGGMIICAMRPGDFTTTGHFIVIYGYTEEGFQVNDPNSRERSGQIWPFSTLKGQIKNLWGLYS